MRTFYIFKINKEFKSLTKESPYNLFKSLEQIYYINRKDFQTAFKLYETIALPFNKLQTNIELFNNFRNNDFYTKVNSIHLINNYFTDERSKLIVKNSHLTLNTTSASSSFLKKLASPNLFICDFKNKDYFWLDQLF